MEPRVADYRRSVIEHIRLIASADAQLEYESSVVMAQIPAELICGFTDDLYHPKSQLMLKAFSSDELKSLAELYGRMCVASDAFSRGRVSTVREILRLPEWRGVMTFAKQLLGSLGDA